MNWPVDFTTSKQAAPDRAGGFVSWFGGSSAGASVEDVSEREMRRIRAKQIDAVTRLVPVTMTVNLGNVLLVLFVFWGTGSNIFLSVWALAICSAAAVAIRSWVRLHRAPPLEASRRTTRRMTIQAFLLAAAWGMLPMVLLPVVVPTQQLIVACLMAGMISGGAFTLSTVPSAGLAYTWTLSFASAGALLLCRGETYVVTAIFLLIYGIFISRNLVAHGDLFFHNLRAQLQLERQTEIISLLLKEFQENASDWLWQTDGEGRLIHVPARFAEVAQIPAQLLHGAKLVEAMEMLCPPTGRPLPASAHR
jgi:PAS domain-containing protein